MDIPSKPKIATVTASDVAIFLSKRTTKKRRSDRKVRPSDSVEDISTHFLENFSASNLLQILKHKVGKREEPITLEWIVKKMISLLDSPDAKVAERLVILDRLRELLLLGGLQNPEFVEEIVRRTATGFELKKTEDKDPFAGASPVKLRNVS